MTSVRKSLLISLAERYLLLGLKLGSFIILARLLTPEEIGIYSVAAAFIGLAHVLRDFGIGSYLIQEEELTNQRVKTAFSITLLLGMSLALIILLVKDTVADFYSDPRLAPILAILAINFLIIPFGSVGMSLLRREMDFSTSMKINLASASVGFAFAIGFAWHELGYWALVASSIASIATTSLLATLLSPRRRQYGISLAEWKRILHYSGRASIIGIISEMATNINELVVGRSLGFEALALLSRAQGTMKVFHQDIMASVRRVAFPAFAQANRAKEDIDARHSYAVVLITAVAWPFYGFLALYASEILHLLFGPQWGAAAKAVPLMCAAGAIVAPGSLIKNMLMATGRIKLALRAFLVIHVSRVVILLACAVWFSSLMGFAVGILISFAVVQITLMVAKHVAFGTYLPGAARGLGASAILTATTLVPAILAKVYLAQTYPTLAPEVVALIGGLLFGAAWLGSVALLRHPIYTDAMFYAVRKYLDRILVRPPQ